MKPLIPLLLSTALIACSSPEKDPTEHMSSDFNLSLLEGKWARTNNAEGQTTFEHWTIDGSILRGLGFTLVESDTVFKEVLAIVEADGERFYDVRGVNPEPTLFKFTDHTESTFVCANDSNEFPKRIEYRVFQDSMVAIISAGEQEVTFNFKRVE